MTLSMAFKEFLYRTAQRVSLSVPPND